MTAGMILREREKGKEREICERKTLVPTYIKYKVWHINKENRYKRENHLKRSRYF